MRIKTMVLLMMLVLLVTGCRSKPEIIEPAPYQEPVDRLAIENMPMDMTFALTSGTLSYFGVKLLYEQPVIATDMAWEYELFYSQSILKKRMMDQKVDVALIPFELALQLQEAGVPYKLVGVLGMDKPVLIGKSPIEEMRRQNVHVFYDHMHFFTPYLKTLGLQASDVNAVVWTDEMAMMTAYEEGRIDFALVSSAQYKRLMNLNVKVQALHESSRMIEEEIGLSKGIPSGVLVVRSLFAEDYPEAIAQIEMALTGSDVWLKRNSESARVYAEQLDLIPEGTDFIETLNALSLSYEPNTQARFIFSRYFYWLEKMDPTLAIDRRIVYQNP